MPTLVVNKGPVKGALPVEKVANTAGTFKWQIPHVQLQLISVENVLVENTTGRQTLACKKRHMCE